MHAAELPVVFARSGQKIAVSVGGDHRKTLGGAVLWAYGHVWGEPVMEKGGVVELTAPEVRVPVAFQVVSVNPADGSYRGMSEATAKLIHGELVVYPERWNERKERKDWGKHTQWVTAGTPVWFDTWAEVVGLPVKKFQEIKSLDAGHWRMLEKPGLLIVGSETPGNSPATVHRLSADYSINVLTLRTDWFHNNETTSREIVLSPKHMTGALADLQTQNWPLPPAFWQRTVRISNRQPWIAGPEHPLVEEIRSPQKGGESLRTVFSYLPWQRQLGRKEMADELFLRLLTETAKGAKDRPPLDGRWLLLYPAVKDIKAGDRPVLAAALKSAETDVGGEAKSPDIHAYVLDLCGTTAPPADFFEGTGILKTVEGRIGTPSPLLILGDSPMLDTWKWPELDRQHHRSPRPGVVWWPDSSVPPSLDSQLRLMQLFTEWNISLEDISQE